MGPSALFDKSFLQSLHVDESVWFDRFFSPNICPLFYVETLADLDKSNLSNGRTPERLVAIIAEKTPEFSGTPNVHHQQLCISELMGQRVPMTGQIPVAGGRRVNHKGRPGAVFDISPEARAFSRWQLGEFDEVERSHAKGWRDMLSKLNLPAVARAMQSLGINSKAVKTLEEAAALARSVVHNNAKPFDQIQLVFNFVDIPKELMHTILERWSIDRYRPLAEYAPYVAHVLTVEVFFQIALGSGLISAERASNRADIAYLFYLPFCDIFTSTDKLHRRCAPLFLRADQDFIWGEDLKKDLRRLNDHYAQLPVVVKEAGISSFANRPAGGESDLIIQLWDRHLPGWREKARPPQSHQADQDEKLMQHMKSLRQAPIADAEDFPTDAEELHELSIERFVLRKKGSWYQVPKDLNDDSADRGLVA